MNFINSFQSEWLKKKRSLASWLVLVGAFFTPLIILAARIKNHDKLSVLYASEDSWVKLWDQTWESMAAFLLPIGIILATGLITQLEYKNNAWKQLHTTPQSYTTIFLAKMAVILVMMVEVFVLFNIAMYLSAVIPAMLFQSVPYPSAPIPYARFLQGNVNYFIDCLPILALQYLFGLQFKNFLAPIGIGLAIWFLGLGMNAWEYSYVFPYIHSTMDFLIGSKNMARSLPVSLQTIAFSYFVVITIVSYVLYVTKKEKG